MQQAEFDGKGSCIRWTETRGAEPACVYVHGLGSVSAVYHAHIAARPGRFGYTLGDHADALSAALDEANEFVDYGHARVLQEIGPLWAAHSGRPAHRPRVPPGRAER